VASKPALRSILKAANVPHESRPRR
jgi:hypothetical protein